MRAARLLRQPVVLEHVDQDGDPDDMGDPEETKTWTLFRGYAWWDGASESTANEHISDGRWRFALEPSAADQVAAGDRLIVDGELDDEGNLVPDVGTVFEVYGEVWTAKNPRTLRVEYVHGALRRMT